MNGFNVNYLYLVREDIMFKHYCIWSALFYLYCLPIVTSASALQDLGEVRGFGPLCRERHTMCCCVDTLKCISFFLLLLFHHGRNNDTLASTAL